MKIGELAKKTGCQVVTIRYYEKEGLLPEPERSEGNYRLYSEADIERLRFIRHCRHHDMKLAEICRENDVGLIAMKGLSGGLITNAASTFAFLRQ